MRKPEYYYLMVTKDELELPLVVADTAAELSRIVGCHPSHVSRSIDGWENGLRPRRYKSKKIEGTFRRVKR